MNLEDEDEGSEPLSRGDRLMLGLPADATLRKHMRRAASSGMDYLVIRLLAHETAWGSYHELMDEWTLDELVDANRASDVTDRLRELNNSG